MYVYWTLFSLAAGSQKAEEGGKRRKKEGRKEKEKEEKEIYTYKKIHPRNSHLPSVGHLQTNTHTHSPHSIATHAALRA
jgi:hypothetical protein